MSDRSLHFFMAMNPPTATKQEHRVSMSGGRVRVFPSPAWARAADDLRAHLEGHRPEEPLRGPVRLSTVWCFGSSRHGDGTPKTSRPDTDNLQKGLKDLMTDLGWWADDSQVFSETCTKIWSRIPGIRIDIDVVEEER